MKTRVRFTHFFDDDGLHDSISHFVSYDALDCTISIDHLALHSGDKMYMHMKYFLAGSFSDIHADVISIGIQVPVDGVLHFFEKSSCSTFFFSRKLEKVIHMPLSNDKRMSPAHGAPIPYRKSVLILIKNVSCRDRTKRARNRIF